MIKNIRNSSTNEDEFIDLSLVINAVRQGWRIIVSCLVCLIVVSVAVYLFVSPRWQATVTLKIGEIASDTSPRGWEQDLVEPLTKTIADMHLRQFEDGVFSSLPLAEPGRTKEIKLFRRTLKVVQIKNTGLLKISVAGTSSENARKLIEATANTLIASHNQIMQPIVRRKQNRLKNISSRIEAQEVDLVQLKRLLQNGWASDNKSRFAYIIGLDILDRQETDLQELIDEKLTLEDLLDPKQTFPTAIVGSVKVDGKPYFPNLGLFLIAAILIGSLSGILLSLYFYKKKQNDVC